jgi:hypothetical protein
MTDTLIDDDDIEFRASAVRGMQKEEAEWRRAGKVFSWIDLEPDWVSAAEWYMGSQWGYPAEPTAPCNRILRFSLIGGGQIKVTEEWRLRHHPPYEPWLSCYEPRLAVKAHTEEGLSSAAGLLDHGACYEMAAYAVVFGHNTPQAIADRVAATLRAIDTNSDNFRALLDGSTGCAFCGRALRDEISKLIAVGPDCARRCGIPHNVAAANRRLERRRALLGDAA